ncbi:MAG: TlpA family protein disulfide reductase [Prevotella sp.]|nr:TlpA family protein disulfide reductase [Prevotella sp.]
MKFKAVIILMSLLFISEMEAQNIQGTDNGFNLEVTYPGQEGKKIYFGQYWRGSTYARDSVKVSASGKAVFSSKEKYPEGQYFIYIAPDLRTDLLIGNEQSKIQININSQDYLKSSVSGSNDTRLLWSYMNKVNENERIIEALNDQLADPKTSSQKKASLQKEIAKEEELAEAYIESLLKENKTSWFTTFLKGMTSVNLPYPNPKTEKEFTDNKNFGKAHYFDNINLTDPRLWRTNYMTSYIDTYMRQWVEPIPDSLAIAASKLVAKTKSNEACFKEMLSYMVNMSTTSDRMGDENIWAKLCEEYIFDKKLKWIDSIQMSGLQYMYEHIKNNRIGMRARNIKLTSMDGKTIETNDIQAEYLMIYFYGHDCHYCLEETPRIYNDIYLKYKDKGLQVVAIDIKGSDKKEWEKFVKDNKMTGWINAADPNNKSQYWMNYDTSYIPSVFVLDKNKKIIAKKIDSEALKHVFDHYIK